MEMSLDESFNDNFEDLISENSELLNRDEKNLVPQKEHLALLRKRFGHNDFRPLQWRIISSIIYRKIDNCAIMTTGYGKSLCFQYPSVFMGGITFIVSPLISLMQDQVLALQVSNISACLLGSANSSDSTTISEILEKKYSLVYLTPELCYSDRGRAMLENAYKNLDVVLIAIDEAHCVSSWGHDFRPKYRQLGQLKELMPNVPILAVTATATPKVEEDIIKSLKLRNPQMSHSGFDRPNFYFAVHRKSRGCPIYADLQQYMVCENDEWKFPGPTIIYTISRNNTEVYSKILEDHNIKSQPYHAGLPLYKRKLAHENFIKDRIDVIVATIAFGMGIDKPDIRMVIHYGMPSCIESYYQEAGRAGRDGEPAKTIIFHSKQDMLTYRMIWSLKVESKAIRAKNEENLKLVEDFINIEDCRRNFILKYFGDKPANVLDKSTCCDNCLKQNTPLSEILKEVSIYEGVDENGKYDFTEDCKKLLSVVKLHKRCCSMGACIGVLLGKENKRGNSFASSKFFGCGQGKSKLWWKEIGELCLRKKLLAKKKMPGTFYQLIELTKEGDSFLIANKKMLENPHESIRPLMIVKDNVWLGKTPIVLSIPKLAVKASSFRYDGRLHGLLVKKRRELAESENCSPFMIASNAVVRQMVIKQPRYIHDLKKYVNFPEAKAEKFGHAFIEVIKANCQQNGGHKISIRDILLRTPVPGANEVANHKIDTIQMVLAGYTCQEIALQKNRALSTVMNHIADGIMAGYPITLSSLSITKELRDTIIQTAEKLDTGFSLLTPIKQNCPLTEVTFDQINIVRAYYKVRQHLNRLGAPYQEFEDFNSGQMPTEQSNESVNEDDLSQLIDNLEQAASEIDEIDTQPISSGSSRASTSKCLEPKRKRQKMNEDDDCIYISSDDEMLDTRLARLQSSNYLLDSAPRFTNRSRVLSDDEILSAKPGRSQCRNALLDSPPRSTVSRVLSGDEILSAKPSISQLHNALIDSPPTCTDIARVLSDDEVLSAKPARSHCGNALLDSPPRCTGVSIVLSDDEILNAKPSQSRNALLDSPPRCTAVSRVSSGDEILSAKPVRSKWRTALLDSPPRRTGGSKA